MRTRSSHNWGSRSGTWDALNLDLVNFTGDYPVIGTNKAEFTNVVICNDYKAINAHCLISTFADDYILERFWNKPPLYIEKFIKASVVLSPDFSLLIGMPQPTQIYNTYRNRLLGKYWQDNGINVVPTICWSDERSYEYCFKGVKKGSIVAVSNIGCNDDKAKKFFDDGLNEMIKQISPSKIIIQRTVKYKEQYSSDLYIPIPSYWQAKKARQQ